MFREKIVSSLSLCYIAQYIKKVIHIKSDQLLFAIVNTMIQTTSISFGLLALIPN
jgi:hypothetical protein